MQVSGESQVGAIRSHFSKLGPFFKSTIVSLRWVLIGLNLRKRRDLRKDCRVELTANWTLREFEFVAECMFESRLLVLIECSSGLVPKLINLKGSGEPICEENCQITENLSC